MISEAAQAVREIDIRAAWPSDQAFVASTMREQLCRRHGDIIGMQFKRADILIDRILDSERTRVLVACDGKRIIGWLAYVEIPRVRALLFAYVRKDDREQGVAARLAAQAWPRATGKWVYPGGIQGYSAASLLRKFDVAEVDLEELL